MIGILVIIEVFYLWNTSSKQKEKEFVDSFSRR